MPRAIPDFRKYAYSAKRIEDTGRYIGRVTYPKLYVIENLVRILIHSVLSSQIGTNWWSIAVSPRIRSKAQAFRLQYTQNPWHTTPGGHDIYLIFLSDLTEIIRANSAQFLPVVSDVDNWIARLEQIRIPRNLVGHMNFLDRTDRNRIDVFYADFLALLGEVTLRGVTIQIP